MLKKLQLLLVGAALCFGTIGCGGSDTTIPSDADITAPPAEQPTGEEVAPPPPSDRPPAQEN